MLTCVSLIVGCGTPATHQSLKNDPLPELISSYTFFESGMGYWRYKISPDGKRVAYQTQKNDLPGISIWEIGSDDVSFIKSQHTRLIRDYNWLQDSHRIVYSQAVNKDTTHLFLVDASKPSHPPIDLIPSEEGRNELVHIGQVDTNMIWMTDYSQEDDIELLRLDLSTNAVTLVEKADASTLQWVVDASDRLRARFIQGEGLRRQLDLYDPDQYTWKKAIEWEVDEKVDFLSFSSDNRSMWLLSNRNRERSGIVLLDLSNGKENLFYEDPHADVAFVTMSKKQKKPLIAYSFPDYPKVHFIDPQFEEQFKPFLPATPTGFLLTGVDDNEEIFGFTLYSDKAKDNYIYNSRKNTKQLFGDSSISLYASKLSEVRPIAFSGRDGMKLKGFLTLPKGVQPSKLPTVLLVHGGPWARDDWEYDNLVQFLANRGYAVLQVNYRGSTGFGKSYMRGAIGEFAGKMHHDLVDGLKWAVDKGFTDPDYVAIMGWSYGGYASLVGLTFTPDLFKCAIAIAGMSDLTTLVDASYRNLSLRGEYYWHKYVGNPRDGLEHKRMKAKSPISHIDKITRPLLLVHGGEDDIVSSEESDRMATAMRKADKQVDYVFFPDEGHTFEQWKNWSVLYKKIEKFLASHLGGRSS